MAGRSWDVAAGNWEEVETLAVDVRKLGKRYAAPRVAVGRGWAGPRVAFSS